MDLFSSLVPPDFPTLVCFIPSLKEKNDPQLFSSLSCLSVGWCRSRDMFAPRFTPPQRLSSADLNPWQRPELNCGLNNLF